MENNSFCGISIHHLGARGTRTFTRGPQPFRHKASVWGAHREQAATTQTRFYNDADDAITDQMSFNEMQPKTADDSGSYESLRPAFMVDGQHVLWDLQSPNNLVLSRRVRLHRGLDGGVKLPLRGAREASRADNKIDTQTDTNRLDPNEVPQTPSRCP